MLPGELENLRRELSTARKEASMNRLINNIGFPLVFLGAMLFGYWVGWNNCPDCPPPSVWDRAVPIGDDTPQKQPPRIR